MKPDLEPTPIALIIAGAVTLLAALLGLVLLPYSHWFWLFLGCVGVSSFVLVRWLLALLIYRRLTLLYHKLNGILKRRTNNGANGRHSSDAITGLYQAILDVSGTIRQEMSQMQEVDLLRKEFIGNVSHELKTPIFAIEGFIETLLDGALEDKKVNKKFLKQALKNVQRLDSLVQDLLTISQLEAGELVIHKEPFSIYELVLDVMETLDYKRKSRSRNVEFAFLTNGLEDIYVYADPDRIRQVLDNLINNAIKYGKPDGLVTVELGVENDKMIVYVRDNGDGIAPEHLPRLFERFYRVDQSRARANGGTGLGLAIVKNLLEVHGEEIQIASELGRGTVFSFTISLYKDAQ